MAFKNWQIGLHLQQQEAVAVAIVRSAKECLLHRWWRLPLENDIIKDGRIVDVQRLANTLLPWSRELPQRHHIMLAFPASRTLQRSFPRPSMSLGEREQMAWLSGTMARELDMDPDSLRFDYSEDSLSPAYNVTAAQSKELATLLTLAERLRVHVSAITPDASALQRFLPFLPSHQQCLAWRDNEQWLWATRYSWGRKLAVGMTSAKEAWRQRYLLIPKASRYVAKADLTPGRRFLFVSRRYRHQVETLPSRWGWRLGRCTDEPAN